MNGDWWTWPEKTISGRCSSIGGDELRVAEMAAAAPAHRRAVGRGVVHPDPAPPPARRVGGELLADRLPLQRAVPPGADAEERVVEHERIAVAGDAVGARREDPLASSSRRRAVGIEVVIAGADDERACAP